MVAIFIGRGVFWEVEFLVDSGIGMTLRFFLTHSFNTIFSIVTNSQGLLWWMLCIT